MAYWLVKSEPNTFSIDDLERVGVEHWDGVRNFTARTNLRSMVVGDQCFFYHSVVDPIGVAGICEVAREAYPDPSQFDPDSKYFDPKSNPEKPRWYMPDMRFVRKFPRVVTLREIKETPGLEEMSLVKYSRLSVQPVTDTEWKLIVALAED